MIVKLDLDPRVVWQLTDEAERSGMRLGEYAALLLELKSKPVKRTTRRPYRQARIVELHGEGFTDQEIADQLECVRAYVVQIRRRHGLKPNRRAM